MRVFPETIVSAASMGADVTSSVLDLYQMIGYSIQAVWTGTPTGTLKLQGSNDGTTYSDISDSSQSLTGSAGDFLYVVTDVFYRYARLVYTRSSSTGTLTAKSFARGF